MDYDHVKREIESLSKGDVIWTTYNYLAPQGVRTVKFYDACHSSLPCSIWAIPLTTCESGQQEVENTMFMVSKPDWHTTPQAAYARVTLLTMQKQQQALEANLLD